MKSIEINLFIIVILAVIGIAVSIIMANRSKKQKEQSQAPAVSVLAGNDRVEPGQHQKCRSVILTLNSANIPRFKEQVAPFSSKLSNVVLTLRDRIAFQGMLIVVTQLEPEGPAQIVGLSSR